MKTSVYAQFRQVKVTKTGKEIFDRKATEKAIKNRLEYFRAGEWNEAICFTSALHPRCEIAAQKTSFRRANGEMVNYWSVFFVSSRSAYTVATGLNRESAYRLAKKIAPFVLNSKKPFEAARAAIAKAQG